MPRAAVARAIPPGGATARDRRCGGTAVIRPWWSRLAGLAGPAAAAAPGTAIDPGHQPFRGTSTQRPPPAAGFFTTQCPSAYAEPSTSGPEGLDVEAEGAELLAAVLGDVAPGPTAASTPS